MHPLLERQLTRHLGSRDGLSPEMQAFLAAVDAAYHEHDSDRTLLERSMDLSSGELVERNQELGDSLRRLKDLQRQLLDASRRMGMADVASAVLHNVGNVLNSVNVSAGMVAELVRNSRTLGLSKAAVLLRAHEHDREQFLTQDEKGKRLPEFFCQLADAAEQERATVLLELEALQKNIDHIKVIINTQQSHAKAGGVIEIIDLNEMVEDVIKVSFDSHDRNWVIRDLQAPNRVTVDRHKLMQILLNLLGNARHAVRDGNIQKPRIVVRTRSMGERHFAIEIEDNGVGIEAKNLTQIFTHGFTTKKNGHGFGLHSSSCAASDLGGTLQAHSAGTMRGACFTLQLPYSGPSRSLRAQQTNTVVQANSMQLGA